MSLFFVERSVTNNNIIRFYILANKLKYMLRAGWLEIGIKKDRIESIAEHVYGTLVLAIAIDSEYKLDLDMFKVLKMLVLHETEEILMPDYTIRSRVTKEEKKEKGRQSVHLATKGLIKQEEIESLLEEAEEQSSKEAVFCYLIDKIECDFQAKLYDLEGNMDYEKSRNDVKYYNERAKEIESKSKTASDFWIEYDKPKFEKSELFKKLVDDIQKIDNKEYKEIIDTEV